MSSTEAPGLEFAVRAMIENDRAFVASTWLRDYEASPWGKRIAQEEYFDCHGKVVNAAITRGTTLVAEHVTAEGPVLLGFACGERTQYLSVVHYVYVKGYARRNGIGDALYSALLAHVGGKKLTASHRKAPATEIMARRKIAYSPYPLFRVDSSRR